MCVIELRLSNSNQTILQTQPVADQVPRHVVEAAVTSGRQRRQKRQAAKTAAGGS